MSGQENKDQPADWSFEPPIDHLDLCNRVRFSLDDPPPCSEAARAKRDAQVRQLREELRSKHLRVSSALMPELHRVIRNVSERLMLQTEPEVFIEQNSSINAHALPSMLKEPPAIILQSSLVELLTLDELASVVGHELAHVTFDHAPRMHETTSAAAEHFALENSRAAEMSADRVGLLAAPTVEAALMAEVKIKTGLSSRFVRLDIPAILENFKNPSEDFDRTWEITTHPEMALRFWSQMAFTETDLFRRIRGQEGGKPFAETERDIEERFLALGSGAAFRSTVDKVHEVVAWMGVLIVCEDGNVAEREREALVRHVGELWADDACAYAKRNGLKAVERRAKESVRPLMFTGTRTRNRLESRLRSIAAATGAPDKAERLIEMLRSALNEG
jgi:hypothetical protein